MRVTDLEGTRLTGDAGCDLGTVESVLFHPSEPRVVALMVRPDRMLGVVKRGHAVVPLAGVILGADGPAVASAKLPGARKTELALGYDPESTVIWRGMPVVSESGERAGTVHDVEFSPDGSVLGVELSTGVAGDVAHGRLEVPAEVLRRFDGCVIVIGLEPEALRATGGVAREAGKRAAAVRVGASATAKAAGEAIVDASYIAGHAIRSAAETSAGRKAKSAWRAASAAVREAMDGDEKPPSD